MTDPDLSAALDVVRNCGWRDEIQSACRLLLSAADDVEPGLLEIMADGFKPRQTDGYRVAARILAERDPDRDPEYLLRYLRREPMPADSPARRWAERRIAFPPIDAIHLGLTRLRRFDPVLNFGRLLKHPYKMARGAGAQALGDTAEPRALDPLADALADPHWWVRMSAAMAVRRLNRTTSAPIVEHPIRGVLVIGLADRNKRVAREAAYALLAIGDDESVREYAAKHRRVPTADIPPLFRAWPGDETV
ncbi:MAG TPA: HEAT repeat domain-containing protein [Pseudonocardiaceae bacterium]|jgi:hypothetical protein|nr:HEAT repeat domain-containing protein [Pseudonocardiaceae bacterium]